jgi:hypothetical protein
MAEQDTSGILAQLRNGVQAINRLAQNLSSAFPVITGTSSSATGGSATLPANPVGFITVTLPNGTSARVPYYD